MYRQGGVWLLLLALCFSRAEAVSCFHLWHDGRLFDSDHSPRCCEGFVFWSWGQCLALALDPSDPYAGTAHMPIGYLLLHFEFWWNICVFWIILRAVAKKCCPRVATRIERACPRCCCSWACFCWCPRRLSDTYLRARNGYTLIPVAAAAGELAQTAAAAPTVIPVAAAAGELAQAAAATPADSAIAQFDVGEEAKIMFHGTDSRSAQLIATRQRFRRSASGLLGEGIYVTSSLQKAQGYRTHHPNAKQVGGEHRNLPLLNGDPDPGCILACRVRLGACKTLDRDSPTDEFKGWDSDFNSAFSAGCPCCPVHGNDCPGHTSKGHRPEVLGLTPCRGRCATGWRRCPYANSAFEEYCIWAPDRIDHIEVIEGPAELVGFGREYWEAGAAEREAAHTAKDAEIKAWAVAHPDAASHHTLMKQYRSAQAANQLFIGQMGTFVIAAMHIPQRARFIAEQSLSGQDAAAAAARKQAAAGGVIVRDFPHQDGNGAYKLVLDFDLHSGWPHYRHVSGSPHLFYATSSDEWIISKQFDPAGTGSSSSAEDARTVSDGGLVPVGKKIWLVAGRNPCKIGTAMAEGSEIQQAAAKVEEEIEIEPEPEPEPELEPAPATVLDGGGAEPTPRTPPISLLVGTAPTAATDASTATLGSSLLFDASDDEKEDDVEAGLFD